MSVPSEDLTEREIEMDTGPGNRLRSAREKAGFSLEEVSARLHLDRRTIEMLEAEDYRELPAPTFVRGYLRSYARLLDLPAEPMVEAFDRQGFGPPALIADIAHQSQARSSDLWVVGISVFLFTLLIVLAAMWYQANQPDEREMPQAGPASGSEAASSQGKSAKDGSRGSEARATARPDRESHAANAAVTSSDRDSRAPDTPPSAPPAASPATAVGQTAATGASTAGGAEAPQIAGASVNGGETPAVARSNADEAESTTNRGTDTATRETQAPSSDASATSGGSPRSAENLAATAATVANSQPAPSSQAATSSSQSPQGPIDTVVMRFARDAWVEMYDARGKRLYYNLARAGRTIEVAGARPIRVLLGYVKGVQVEYNGAPFDFSQYISRGIARFEMRP